LAFFDFISAWNVSLSLTLNNLLLQFLFVNIYDTLGRKVLELQIDTDYNTIDVSELKGMHLVSKITSKKTITKLVAINL